MKQRLKRLLVRLLSLLPGKPVILLESAPPLGDNTGALYRDAAGPGLERPVPARVGRAGSGRFSERT